MKDTSCSSPKMTRQEAVTLWNTLTPAQKLQFNEMLTKLNRGELMFKHVTVDDNEVIQHVVLEPKDKPGEDHKKYAKFFPQDKPAS